MSRICLFPGTFDPVTLGHVDIINRAIPLFDKIIVGIGKNTIKAPMFSAEQRLEWIKDIYKNKPCIEGAIYEGLTVDFCKRSMPGLFCAVSGMSAILNMKKQLLMPTGRLTAVLRQFF
jgi:pantetheine-phosphate adenylyltransferase